MNVTFDKKSNHEFEYMEIRMKCVDCHKLASWQTNIQGKVSQKWILRGSFYTLSKKTGNTAHNQSGSH